MRVPALTGFVLLAFLGTQAQAQAPSPPPARKRPAARPPAEAKPAATPAPKPKPVLDRLIGVVEAARPADPVDEAQRKLVLARVALEKGDLVKATTLLDGAAALVEPLPKIDPEDKEGKRINFRRSGLRSEWIRLTARMDPVKALQAAVEYASETNLLHHGSLLNTLVEDLDCSSPERKAAVEANLRLLLDPLEQALKDRTWGLSNAPTAIDAVTRAARRCGLDPVASRARDVASRALDVFESTDLRIRACDMAMTKVRTTLPAERAKAIGGLARYQLKPQFKGDEPDRCLVDKLDLAATLASEVPADDPARPLLADLVAGSVAQLDEKKLKYYHCSAIGALEKLPAVNAAAVDKGVALALDAWRKGDSVASYCDVPTGAARIGSRLAAAGAPPAWRCTVLSAQPEGKPLDDAAKATLRKQRALAALELRGACPEAEAALQFDRSDLALLKAVRVRQLVLDRAATEPLVGEDLAAIPEAERYAYATALLPAFWAKAAE
jgi:hypothetical protein